MKRYGRHIRVAKDFHMPLERVLELPQRWFLALEQYLEEQLNNPSPTEYYLMQLCFHVKRIWNTSATLESCRMKFGRTNQVPWEETLSEAELLQYEKAVCLAAVGYKRSREELIADGINPDD